MTDALRFISLASIVQFCVLMTFARVRFLSDMRKICAGCFTMEQFEISCTSHVTVTYIIFLHPPFFFWKTCHLQTKIQRSYSEKYLRLLQYLYSNTSVYKEHKTCSVLYPTSRSAVRLLALAVTLGYRVQTPGIATQQAGLYLQSVLPDLKAVTIKNLGGPFYSVAFIICTIKRQSP